MCYAIPGKVVAVNGNIAVIDYFGEKRNVLRDCEDIMIGEYVYAQGGIIIQKLPESEAEEILSTWKEQFFKLKQRDKKLSQKSIQSAPKSILSIMQKINLKKSLSRGDVYTLLRVKDKNELNLLYTFANNLRQKEHKNACCVHGIIEFSNYCKNNCFYCGIRRDKKLQRYRMRPQEIVDTARNAVQKLGFKALVLQSGEDSWYNEEKLLTIVREIRKLGVLIFLSIGIRKKETYQKLYEAGARAVLLRFETSNKRLFEKIRPDTSFEERINLLRDLKEIGYLITTGFLMGLPEETEDDLVNNLLLTQSLQPDMYSFGPLIPAPGTPFENEKLTKKEELLKFIAIARLLDRKSKIVVTTALETYGMDARREGLLAGANSLMINLTPPQYKELYDIYPQRPVNEASAAIKETIKLLHSLGRAPTDLGV